MKPQALIVTRNLPPLIGGMERLVWHIVDELCPSYQVHVVGPLGCRQHLPSGVNTVEVSLNPMFLFLFKINLATLWLALRNRPQIIMAGSGLTAPFVWLAARIIGARCVVYLHGLDIIVKNTLYHVLWLPFFRHFDCVLVNSRSTRQLAIEVSIPPERIKILHPGVELPCMSEQEKRREKFRKFHNIGNEPVLLSVGRITTRKGLSLFADNIFPEIVNKIPDVHLFIVGASPADALMSDNGEYKKINAILQENGLKARVHWLGRCSENELKEAYFASDVHVFPVQKCGNDIEGFGMVAIEAAAHGVPTVAFAVGGVTDAVADGVCGELIPAGNNHAFAVAVISLLEKQTQFKKLTPACIDFAELFEWTSFGNQLRMLFSELENQSMGSLDG